MSSMCRQGLNISSVQALRTCCLRPGVRDKLRKIRSSLNWKEAHVEEVGRILPLVVGRHMQDADSRLVQVLGALWPRAVGKSIAQHSRPVSFVSGTLTLATTCPSWAAQLGRMGEEVRATINGFLGRPLVRSVRVRHTPNLVLHSDKSKAETQNWELETGKPKLASPDSKPVLELGNLDPEIAPLVQEAFARYFSKAGKGLVPGTGTVTGL
jgi:Dna[CI] antecedent, DciA